MRDKYCSRCGKELVPTNMGWFNKRTGKPVFEWHCPTYFEHNFWTGFKGYQDDHE